jgi:hypothetical protein
MYGSAQRNAGSEVQTESFISKPAAFNGKSQPSDSISSADIARTRHHKLRTQNLVRT